MDDYLPPVHDLDLQSCTTILNSKRAITVPSKGFDDLDVEDNMSNISSEESYSDFDSSDLEVEASWVDGIDTVSH